LCLGIVLFLAISLDWPEGKANLLLVLVGGGFAAVAALEHASRMIIVKIVVLTLAFLALWARNRALKQFKK